METQSLLAISIACLYQQLQGMVICPYQQVEMQCGDMVSKIQLAMMIMDLIVGDLVSSRMQVVEHVGFVVIDMEV